LEVNFMNKPSSLTAIFQEFLTLYPLHFGLLFLVVLSEGAVAILSILAIIPLGDFMLDSTLKSPSRVTSHLLNITDYMGISPNFWLLGLFLVGLHFLKGSLDILSRYSVLRIKYAVVRGLIAGALQTFFKARWEFFSGSDQGKLLNTFNKEAAVIGDTLGHMATLIAQVIQLGVYLVVPFWLNSSITMMTMGLALLFCAPFLLLQRLSYRLGQGNTETANEAMGVLSEVIAGARLILGFGRQAQAHDRYLRSFNRHIRVTIKSQTLGVLVPSLFRPLGMLAAIIAMGYSLKSDSHISELAAVLWSLLAVLPILGSIMQGNLSIKNFLPAYEQLVSLRESAVSVSEIEGDRIFQRLRKGIEFRHVDFTYPDREQTLRDIQIEIRKGEMTALVGESGSGKSTISDLVLGMQIPERGTVLLDRISFDRWKQNSFRERVGYVPQDPFLFHTSIRENLLWAYDDASEAELWECCRIANAEAFVKALPEGIDTIVGDRGIRLSGGQRQRIALARALIRKPELLILDEATSALDTESETEIQKAIDYLTGSVTMLVIAHRLSTIAKADTIYVLNQGRVIEHGSYNELIEKNGKFSQLVRDQSDQFH
jgi:ABC-type multidrug transport system fused ATPase/permease subunit